MPKKSRWILSPLSFLSILNACIFSACILNACIFSACASLPDVPVFEELDQHMSKDPVSGHLILTPSPTCEAQIGEPECGHGVTIVTQKQIFVGNLPAHLYNGKTWQQLKDESVYCPAVESYAPLNAYMINSCKKFGCSSAVDSFKIKIGSVQ